MIFNDYESYWRVKLEEEEEDENSTNYPIRWERTEKKPATNETVWELDNTVEIYKVCHRFSFLKEFRQPC